MTKCDSSILDRQDIFNFLPLNDSDQFPEENSEMYSFSNNPHFLKELRRDIVTKKLRPTTRVVYRQHSFLKNASDWKMQVCLDDSVCFSKENLAEKNIETFFARSVLTSFSCS